MGDDVGQTIQQALNARILEKVQVEANVGTIKQDFVASPKYTEPLRDTPQSITVVPAAAIREQGLLTLRDVLSTLPGITFGAGEGGGGYGDSINLRGFTGSSDISIDGVRDSAQYTRSDPFNLEQVELLNGASSAYSGSGSVGGTINMVSKQPHLQDEYQLTVAAGTDRYGRLAADINEQLGTGAALRINAMAHHNDAPGRDFEKFDRWALAPSVAFGLDSATQLVFNANFQKDDNIPQYGVPYFNGAPLPGVSSSSYFGYHNLDRQQIESGSLTATLNHAFASGAQLRQLVRWSDVAQLTTADPPQGVWCLDSGISATGTSCAAPGTFQPYTVTSGVPANGPRGTTRDTDNRILYGQTDLTLTIRTGAIEHAVVAGISLSHETYALVATTPFRRTDHQAFLAADLAAFQGYFPLMSLHAPDSTYRGPLNWTLTGQTTGKLDNEAVYVFDTLKFGPHWQFSTGARFEYNHGYSEVATVSTSGATAGQITGLAEPGYNNNHLFSWRAGLVYKPVEAGTMYLSFANSRTPSRTSVNGSCTATSTAAAGAANCIVDPETAVNVELGTKWDLRDGKLAVTAAIFRNERQNYRVSDPGNPDNPSGEQRLDGSARTEGLLLGLAGNLTDRWSVLANVSLMRSEVLQGVSDLQASRGADYTRGDPLTQTPEQSASLWTTWRLARGLTVGYGATYQGRTALTQHSATNVNGPLVNSDSYVVHRALLSWQPQRGWLLQLNANNLSDAEYYTRIRNNGWATPGDARNAVLSVSREF